MKTKTKIATGDKVRCEHCGWHGSRDDLHEIRDVWSRMEPGDPLWDGDCPQCGLSCFCADTIRQMRTRRSSGADVLAALAGCADALREAGKSFAIHNPLAKRPNLFELHEAEARKALAAAARSAP